MKQILGFGARAVQVCASYLPCKFYDSKYLPVVELSLSVHTATLLPQLRQLEIRKQTCPSGS